MTDNRIFLLSYISRHANALVIDTGLCWPLISVQSLHKSLVWSMQQLKTSQYVHQHVTVPHSLVENYFVFVLSFKNCSRSHRMEGKNTIPTCSRQEAPHGRKEFRNILFIKSNRTIINFIISILLNFRFTKSVL